MKRKFGLHLNDTTEESFHLWVCTDKETGIFKDAEIVQTKHM